MARCGAVALLLAVLSPVHAAGYYATGLYREADAEVSYDDNLGRTGNPRDRKEDFTWRVGAGLGYEALPSADSRFGVAARVDAERLGEYHDLDNLEISAEGWYTIQPQPGLHRPWYEVWGRASRVEHRDSDIRDGGSFEAGVQGGMRLGTAAAARIGYVHAVRWGDGDVFDLGTHAVEFDADWDILPRAKIYGGYSFQWGDLVSTARASPGLLGDYHEFAFDDVFGAGTGADCALRRCAWRLSGDTHFLTGGAQWQITGGLYLDLSTRWFRTLWGENGRYEGLNYRASLYLRF